VHSIINSAWWERAWVYQEFMLATRVTFLVDNLSIPRNELHVFLDTFHEHLHDHKVAVESDIRQMKAREAELKAFRKSNSMWIRIAFFRISAGLLFKEEIEARKEMIVVASKRQKLEAYDSMRSKSKLQWELATFVLRSRADREERAQQYIPLSTLMTHARNCKSTDPRDKVFAFLGLADPRYDIVADYDKSCTENQVLTRVARSIIVVEQRLDILALAMDDRGISPIYDHLPTWVPNWTRPQNFRSDYKRFLHKVAFPTAKEHGRRACRASKDLKPIISFRCNSHNVEGQILRARGIYVTTLDRVIAEDRHAHLWRRFSGQNSNLEIATNGAAKVGDEVWVLLGADEPFVIGKANRHGESPVLCHAMLSEQGMPSSILRGEMINRLDRGEVHLASIDIS